MQLYGFCQGVLNKVLYREALPLGPIPLQLIFLSEKYRIPSNNRCPSINRLSQINTHIW